ncbi:hypothetical protein B0T21DRAFT_406788 [Apiosordaria backusii]|uniref:LCCL domain-containing protein n=1 Tax=Apiosordaria backusii TaxID=314023 RepID=A0AA40EZ86_9PEZI|nr:hypothetical protein B0T21DRAFT_406788 [Apiosordaria backusii]
MAAPADKTIGNLNGKWVMNKTLSTPIEPGLALQGVGWMTRKMPSAEQFTHVEIEQTGTGGMKGSTEKRCLDYNFRDHSDWLFGHVKGQSKWISAAEITDDFLKSGWIETDAEKGGPNGETHLLSHVESYDAGWTATQIWGFKECSDGQRRYARNVVIAKGSERVELQLYYDYLE